MNILFIHQGFPAQFKFLAPDLARAGHRVVALTLRDLKQNTWQGVEIVRYSPARSSSGEIHPWLIDMEAKAIRAEACYRKAIELKKQGFTPDVIVAHPGWGESLFLKEVWSSARLGIYCEFYYNTEGADTGFDPEFPSADPLADPCRLRMKNINNILHLDLADAGISPTHWQASTFPLPFRDKISVIHDGIDTNLLKPNPEVSIRIMNRQREQFDLGRKDELITFVNRNLEPQRGYHIFMRALPELLRRRPNAHVLIIGGDKTSYGAKPNESKYGNRSWKQIFIDEVREHISDTDWKRVHFLGNIPYNNFINVLQASTVHVYHTYPFVLSWSLLEAMSTGCSIVASDTPPLQEVIQEGETGKLVNFFDSDALAESIIELLEQPKLREEMGKNARAFVIENYDLKNVCQPKQFEWVEALRG